MPKPKPKKVWMPMPPKKSKPTVPEHVKEATTTMAMNVIENDLKPKHVLPPPAEARFNYIINISGKWHRNSFYFIAHYACPGPNALSPTFESKFSRMEFIGEGMFALAYLRHTGAWQAIYPALSLTECLQAIKNDPIFQP